MLNEFYRVLTSNGILILLLSQKIDLEKGLEQLEQKFQLKQKINTLVNGQKSTVYKLTK
jgi:ubiquinone/menaquinone biosynthesis C-methylase UbiE